MPTPQSVAIATFHQAFNGMPQLNSSLIQPQTGQLSVNWIPFFQQLWQSLQPNATLLTSAPFDPTVGSPAYQVSQSNQTIFANLNPPAPLHIHLWQAPSLGWSFRIKDAGGNASQFPITVHPHDFTIDGQSSIVLNQNYAMVSVIFNGNEWSIF